MKAISLFSGIGGFDLAALWVWGQDLKIKTFCEIDPFCQKVLKKHWPDVPIHDDIKTMKGNSYGTIDIIYGGFPCQPYSCAGKQKGKEDDRALWPEMFRIIKEAKPRWIIGENVAGFVNMGLDDSLSDLESEGYETTAFIIPACSINAPHRRDRVWIVAHAERFRCDSGQYSSQRDKNASIRDSAEGGQFRKQQGIRISENGSVVTNTNTKRFQKWGRKMSSGQREDSRGEFTGIYGSGWKDPWIEVATRLCGMDDGISGRVDRLKSLGNAIVPQVVYPIMDAIKQIELNKQKENE